MQDVYMLPVEYGLALAHQHQREIRMSMGCEGPQALNIQAARKRRGFMFRRIGLAVLVCVFLGLMASVASAANGTIWPDQQITKPIEPLQH